VSAHNSDLDASEAAIETRKTQEIGSEITIATAERRGDACKRETKERSFQRACGGLTNKCPNEGNDCSLLKSLQLRVGSGKAPAGINRETTSPSLLSLSLASTILPRRKDRNSPHYPGFEALSNAICPCHLKHGHRNFAVAIWQSVERMHQVSSPEPLGHAFIIASVKAGHLVRRQGGPPVTQFIKL
jgi:hypothetical protein